MKLFNDTFWSMKLCIVFPVLFLSNHIMEKIENKMKMLVDARRRWKMFFLWKSFEEIFCPPCERFKTRLMLSWSRKITVVEKGLKTFLCSNSKKLFFSKLFYLNLPLTLFITITTIKFCWNSLVMISGVMKIENTFAPTLKSLLLHLKKTRKRRHVSVCEMSFLDFPSNGCVSAWGRVFLFILFA